MFLPNCSSVVNSITNEPTKYILDEKHLFVTLKTKKTMLSVHFQVLETIVVQTFQQGFVLLGPSALMVFAWLIQYKPRG